MAPAKIDEVGMTVRIPPLTTVLRTAQSSCALARANRTFLIFYSISGDSVVLLKVSCLTVLTAMPLSLLSTQSCCSLSNDVTAQN